MAEQSQKRGGMLDWIEWIGNKLPDPAMLFVIGAVIVMIVSWAFAPRRDAAGAIVREGWMVQPKVFRQAFEFMKDEQGEPVLFEGQPRVLLQFDDAGAPVLELVSDTRRITRHTRPVDAEDQGGGATEPLLDDEKRPIATLPGDAQDIEPLRARNLLTAEGIYWAVSSMVDNFMGFAPLGIVLVGMLGIGVAEKSGLLGAALKAFVLIVPRFLLTPTIVFLGIMSSLGIDAGYVVLPPLAAALYKSIGRSPLVGVAAVFAGVAAGFNANLVITGLDPMLANLSTIGAQIIDPDYVVAPTCNWWFAIASTFVMTLTGWFVTSWLVERRYNRKPVDEGGPQPPSAEDLAPVQGHTLGSGFIVVLTFIGFLAVAIAPIALPQSPLFLFGGVCEAISVGLPKLLEGSPLATSIAGAVAPYAGIGPSQPLWVCLLVPVLASVLILPWCVLLLARGGMKAMEARGLAWATGVEAAWVGGIFIMAVLPGSPLYGADPDPPGFARWVSAIVPLIFLAFLLPGIMFGVSVGDIRNGKDVARLMQESMAGMAPIIVLAFFAAQFIEYFKWSNLDDMLAMWGGTLLAAAQLPTIALIIAFILVTMVFNLFVGSMSAKYTMFAPIFIPMFMMVGISPELTQASYRIGDSVSNVITPLNAYLVIVLVYMQRYVPKAGMGTLVSMMMPYTIVFTIVWSAMLALWIWMGWDLGLYGPLSYNPAG